MLRSRKKTKEYGDDNTNHNGSNNKDVLSSSSSSSPSSHDISSATSISTSQQQHHHHQPIVPGWVLCFIISLVLFLGFASEHYKQSRAADHYHHHHNNENNIMNKQSMTKGNVQNKAHSTDAAAAAILDYDKINKLRYGKQIPTSLIGKSILSLEEDQKLDYDETGQRYHLIFSTDCSPYQHWQSYLVYFTAMKVRQPGHVTRIVSGCTSEEAEDMISWFDEKVQFMSSRFHLHLTPKFSEVKDEFGIVVGDYKFFNKPHGLKYWLEHFELTGYHKDTGTFDHENDIVILIDPDMALMRPITKDFSNERETLIGKRRINHVLSTEVKHGVPFAQTYGLGVQWQKFDLDKIAGENSPAKDVSREEGALYFPGGPPYIGTIRDMYQIAQKWSEFVPHVHAQYPYLLAEMYAYCIAAAHLGLKHQLIDSLMASNPDTGGEAWPLIDRIPPEETCDFSRNADNNKYALPSVIHMCQRYSVGDVWFFGKHRIPHDIYECETPLFEEPPDNLALLYDYKKPPNAKEKKPLSPKIINQETFMVCALTRLLNDAATFYKTATCISKKPNLEMSRKVADLFSEREKK